MNENSNAFTNQSSDQLPSSATPLVRNRIDSHVAEQRTASSPTNLDLMPDLQTAQPAAVRNRTLSKSVSQKAGLRNLHEAFSRTADPTIGIELEFFLVEPGTGFPVPAYEDLFALLPANVQQRTKPEMFSFQVEQATTVHPDVEGASKEIVEFLETATAAADRLGIEIAWKARLDDWEFDPTMILDSPRSRSMLKRIPDKASLLAMNSMHVHVGVPRGQAIEVCDKMQTIIPEAVARCANSPRTIGQANLSSYRAWSWAKEFDSFPHRYGSWDRFYLAMQTLRRLGLVYEAKDNYAWARPTVFGTVELRCCDLPSNLSTVLRTAEFIQTSVIDCQGNDDWPMPSLDELAVRFRNACLSETHGAS